MDSTPPWAEIGLKQMMNTTNSSQIVEGATSVSLGTLLDHVYVKQSLLDNFEDIKCEVKSVYVCLNNN